MNVERYIRLVVGFIVMLTMALGFWVSPLVLPVRGIRGIRFVPVGLHQLVSADHVSAQTRGTGQLALLFSRHEMANVALVFGADVFHQILSHHQGREFRHFPGLLVHHGIFDRDVELQLPEQGT